MKIRVLAGVILMTGGVFAQTFTNYTTTDGLLSNNVLCLDVDASDNVWFGTQNGVSVFDGANWTDHTTTIDPGLADNNIQAISVMSNGDVWVGTDFGASVYDGNSWTTYTTTDGLGNNQIKCIVEDIDGDVWFGTNSGASEFDGANWMNLGTGDGLPFGGVTAIMIQSNGDVWLGSGLGGIMIYDGANMTPITSAANGLIDDRMRGMVTDQQGQRWIGTSEGISVLNSSNVLVTNHTTMYTLPAPDTLNPIEDVEMDNSGNIWVGVYVDYLVTEGGVCAWDGSNWTEYHVADGLIGPAVRALAIDGTNAVWVATSSGVSKISDHAVSISEKEENKFLMFPNPAANAFTIKLKEHTEDEVVRIYNASMQLVKEENIVSGEETIIVSIKEVDPGVYFVQIGEKCNRLIIR